MRLFFGAFYANYQPFCNKISGFGRLFRNHVRADFYELEGLNPHQSDRHVSSKTFDRFSDLESYLIRLAEGKLPESKEIEITVPYIDIINTKLKGNHE